MSEFLEIPESWEKDIKTQGIKQEHFDSWADKGYTYVKRGFRVNPRQDNVIRVLTFPEINGSGRLELIKEFDYTHNLVTDDGDIYYAKKGAGESPAANENFLQARMELRNSADTPAKADNYGAVATPIIASRKTISATYPKTNDTGDPDNTGDAIDSVSYSYSWTTSDFNDAAIQGGCQHDNAAPAGATKLLNHFSITSFGKTSSDTLKMFTNHNMLGV